MKISAKIETKVQEKTTKSQYYKLASKSQQLGNLDSKALSQMS